MKRVFKKVAFLVLVLAFLVPLWLLTFLTPLGRVTGPITAFVIYPMDTAVRYDIIPIIHLLSYTPLINQVVPHFKGGCHTPLKTAINKSSTKIVSLLLDRGATLEPCFRGNILSASAFKPDLIKYLIEERKIIETSPDYNQAIFSTLKCANNKPDNEVSQTYARSLKVMLDLGISPNIRSSIKREGKFYNAPLLSVAALKQCSLPVNILLEYGADPVIAEEALHEFFANKKISDNDSMYEFKVERLTSETVKNNIRMIKQAANANRK